ncbi:hypothetical protein KIN20_012784 [Parelaphostrongylus tenuis]|uniref:Uncharacterized protein n=1 Tax=Parelaphostrongylus tenuis TaxID=148309 RepID=A0AAD5QKH9_PARTN|nr:hypothetical protein KIN20_012784 [Parelaphostrongylus tenuis]
MHSQEKSKERRSQRAMKYITLKIRGGPSNKAMEWKMTTPECSSLLPFETLNKKFESPLNLISSSKKSSTVIWLRLAVWLSMTSHPGSIVTK